MARAWRRYPDPVSCYGHESTYIQTVKRVVFPDTAFTMDSKWAELGADSLDFIQLVMDLERAFNVMIDKSELAPVETVRQLYNLFMHHMSEGITLRGLQAAPNGVAGLAA